MRGTSVHGYGRDGFGAHYELLGYVARGPFGRTRLFDERPVAGSLGPGWKLFRRFRPSYGPTHEIHIIACKGGAV